MSLSSRYSLSLANFWELLFRHKLKCLITPLVIGLAALTVLVFYPRTYRSNSKLFMQVGRESIGLDPAATTGQTIALMQSSRDNEVKSAIEVLSSRNVISKVVDKLGPEFILKQAGEQTASTNSLIDYVKNSLASCLKVFRSIDPISPHEEAIIKIEKNLKVETTRNSTVLNVTYEARSPEKAQTIVRELIAYYQHEHQRMYRNPASADFFAEQIDLLQTTLTDSEKALRDAKSRIGLVSIEARKQSIESQLQKLEQDQDSAEQERNATRDRLKEVTKQLADEPERIVTSKKNIPNEGADLLHREFYLGQLRLLELKSRFDPQHPDVVAAEKQNAEAKKILEIESPERAEVTDDVNPVYYSLALEHKQLGSQLASYEARLQTILGQKAATQKTADELNGHEIELAQLERTEKMSVDKYFQYSKSFEQARIDRALEDNRISSISIVQEATLEEKPVSPAKSIVILGALAFSLATMIGWIAVAEKLDDRFRSELEVSEFLGLPVLGSIPDGLTQGRVMRA